MAVIKKMTSATLLKDIAPVLNIEQFLNYWALESLTLQHDGYAFLLWGDNQPGNFRIYHDPKSDLFHFLPWSMDRAMKLPHNALRASYSFLTRNCLFDTACRQSYAEACKRAVDLYGSLPLQKEATSLARLTFQLQKIWGFPSIYLRNDKVTKGEFVTNYNR
jgi:hypothetical protein